MQCAARSANAGGAADKTGQMRLFAKFLLLSCLLIATIGTAQSAKLDEPLARLLADSYSDTVTAIGEIAGSGETSAATILEALADNRLLFSSVEKLVVIAAKDGKRTNAATGAALTTPPADLTPVRLNNRVRTVVQAALGAIDRKSVV